MRFRAMLLVALTLLAAGCTGTEPALGKVKEQEPTEYRFVLVTSQGPTDAGANRAARVAPPQIGEPLQSVRFTGDAPNRAQLGALTVVLVAMASAATPSAPKCPSPRPAT